MHLLFVLLMFLTRTDTHMKHIPPKQLTCRVREGTPTHSCDTRLSPYLKNPFYIYTYIRPSKF